MLGLLTTIALAATAVFQAQAALPVDCHRNATVVQNDTCNGISAKYNVSTYQLATVNTGIIDAKCDNLQIGEVICLGLKDKDCNTTHIVQSGDTCTHIVNEHNITNSTLLKNNPNVDAACSDLYISEVLCVSSNVYVE